MICAVTERIPEVLGGQKEHLTHLEVSVEVELKLKFEGEVGFSQVTSGRRRACRRHSRPVWHMAL